jgi:hypothetical protein
MSSAAALSARLSAGPDAGPRLAAALRQEVWRALRDARGLAPVAAARADGDDWRLFAAAAWLDGASAASRTLYALSEIFHDDAVRRWGRWAGARAPR